MPDHIILTVSEIATSLAFHEAALNIRFLQAFRGQDGHPDPWEFGDSQSAVFWLKEGQPNPGAIHWGFKADSRALVDAAYASAMAPRERAAIRPMTTLPAGLCESGGATRHLPFG